jgi:hypothetical protein
LVFGLYALVLFIAALAADKRGARIILGILFAAAVAVAARAPSAGRAYVDRDPDREEPDLDISLPERRRRASRRRSGKRTALLSACVSEACEDERKTMRLTQFNRPPPERALVEQQAATINNGLVPVTPGPRG